MDKRSECPPPRASDVPQVVLDTARYATEFSTPQLTSLAQGLEETWHFAMERAKKEHRHGL